MTRHEFGSHRHAFRPVVLPDAEQEFARRDGAAHRAYVGVVYGTFQDRFLPVGGINVQLGKNFSALVTHNGINLHPLLNYTYNRHAFSLIMVKSKYPGVGYSVAF